VECAITVSLPIGHCGDCTLSTYLFMAMLDDVRYASRTFCVCIRSFMLSNSPETFVLIIAFSQSITRLLWSTDVFNSFQISLRSCVPNTFLIVSSVIKSRTAPTCCVSFACFLRLSASSHSPAPSLSLSAPSSSPSPSVSSS
jgi:hypothetical protein